MIIKDSLSPNFASQSGQTLLILLLSTLVALTVGLAITQRTLTDVATSTKGEQSSRAYSAAEAGIQKIYNSTDPTSQNLMTDYVSFDNQASADVASTGLIPQPQTILTSSFQPGLEYPPIDKTSFAQFWLTNPNDVTTWLTNSGTTAMPLYYQNSSIDLYFGNFGVSGSDRPPAVEVNVISYHFTNATSPTGGSFISNRYYYDVSNSRNNGFINQNCTDSTAHTATTYSVNGVLDGSGKLTPQSSNFYCQANIHLDVSAGYVPVLIRVRVLYSESAQKIALVPNCSSSTTCALPPQAVIYFSKGKAGQSQHQLKLFTLKNAVPFAFDYSLFAAGNIAK